jgi:hypothetical protein
MATDPVLDRRRRIAGLVRVGKRLGYGLFFVAIVLFFAGLAMGYTGALTTAIVTCLLVGSVVLAPAIVFGYAVRAAEREDRLTARSSDRQDAP